MRALWDCADYLVLNFTAPAAGPLHAPAQQHALSALLAEAREAQERLAASVRRRVPLLVKWPIRLPDERALAHLARVRDLGYDGVVAAFDSHLERGVVSWEQQVPAACRMLAALLGPRLTLIAVGGIDKAARARALIQAGARLVQVYRAFASLGPPLVARLNRALVHAAAPCVEARPSLASS
jgi:dihydroorotate dehydrogenase